MVLVIGATGLLGIEVCRRLAARGEKVKALVRPTSSREKVEQLRSHGIELCEGDLKDPASLSTACRGADSVVSTASSTRSRQSGDSIESVDAVGQVNLVNAAKSAHIERFLLVSFPHSSDLPFPLADAKRQAEEAISSMNFTIIQANYFMEVWLSPALGFDYENATARIYGAGTNPLSWVSFNDVAEICARALRHPAAERKMIEFGGPDALGPLDVVALFEKIGGRAFTLENITEQALLAQFEQATDSMQKSYAALMLAYARGSAMNMEPVVKQFGITLTTVEQYARAVMANAAKA